MKPWYQSKAIWLAIITFVLAIIPVVAAFVKVLSPTTAMVLDAGVLMVTSILQAAIRIFTDTVIETPARMQAVEVHNPTMGEQPNPKP
jgi:hypothetical protein